MTLREIILFSKAADGNFLFEMVERASGDRIFLVYPKHDSNNTRRKQVRNFVSQLQQELHNKVFPECLETILSIQEEIRTYNERETPTESFTKALNTYAEILLNNPQDKEYIENINAYPKKNQEILFHKSTNFYRKQYSRKDIRPNHSITFRRKSCANTGQH